MTGFGTNRRELTNMVDSKHPEAECQNPADQSTIPGQMGSNKYASQQGMTSFGHPRWEVLGSAISKQSRKSQGIVPSQMGSNQFCSQEGRFFSLLHRTFRDFSYTHPTLSKHMKSFQLFKCSGMIGFGTVRNTQYAIEGTEIPEKDVMISQGMIPSQAGWNRGASQQGHTSFGAPRDVHGE